MELVELELRNEKRNLNVLCQNSPIQTPASSVQHLHTHWMSELHGIVSGEGILYTASGKILLKPKDCVLIDPFVPHYVVSREPDGKLIRLEAYLGGIFNLENSYASFSNYSDIHLWSLDETAFSYFYNAVEELSSCRTGYMEAAAAYMSLFIVSLLRHNDSNGVSRNAKKSKSFLEFETTKQIDDFFTYNYSKPVTINDLSDFLNISPRQAQRLVVRYCGTTFRQELIFVRMEFAKRYLKETELLISEIAERVGYEYTSSFCKAFYKQTGFTPENYRRHVKNIENVLNNKSL